MSDKAKAAKNALILAAGNFGELSLAYFFIIILTRAMGPSGVGQYYYIIALAASVALIHNINSSTFLQKKLSRGDNDGPETIGMYVIVRVLLSLVAIAIILTLSSMSSRPEEFKRALSLSSIYAVVQIFSNLFEAISKANKDVRPISISRIIERLFVLMILFAIIASNKLQIVNVISIIVIGSICQLIMVFILARKYITVVFTAALPKFVKLLGDCSAYFFGSVFALIYYRTDIIMLGWLTSNSDVGFYAAANQLFQICFMTVAIINTVTFPPLMSIAKESREKLNLAIEDITKHAIVYFVGLCFGLFILSQQAIILVFGNAFAKSVWVLQAFSIILFYSMSVSVFGPFFVALERQVTYSLIFGVTALINIIANYFMIQRYSYFGAIYATGFSILISYIMSVFFLKKYIHYRIQIACIGKAIIAAIVMSAVVWSLKEKLSVLIVAPIGFIVYVGMIHVVKYFHEEDYLFLRDQIIPSLARRET